MIYCLSSQAAGLFFRELEETEYWGLMDTMVNWPQQGALQFSCSIFLSAAGRLRGNRCKLELLSHISYFTSAKLFN